MVACQGWRAFQRGDGFLRSVCVWRSQAERIAETSRAKAERSKTPRALSLRATCGALDKAEHLHRTIIDRRSGFIRFALIAWILLTGNCCRLTLPTQRVGGKRSRCQRQGGAGKYNCPRAECLSPSDTHPATPFALFTRA